MKKHYLIKRDNKIVYVKYEYLDGFAFKPTNGIFVDDGVVVAKIIIFKPEFIELVLKKKIKNKLNLYLSLLLSDVDDDSSDNPEYTRSLYLDINRYKALILHRYGKYLDDRYLEALLTKISLIEHGLKTKIMYELEYSPLEYSESRSR